MLILKTTMITIWKAAKPVPPLPLPPIARNNAPPGRKKKNNLMRLPRFIGHPNGIVLCVFNQKRSKSSLSQFDMSAVLVTKKPLVIAIHPTFISHPN